MKEFHIISSGVSLLTNAQKAGILPRDKEIKDEDFWKTLLDNPKEIEKLKDFIKENPYKHSAELNTFLRAVKEKDPSQVEVYLFGTKTASNELCRRAITEYLKELGYTAYLTIEISGYFWEAKRFDERRAVNEFEKGVTDLLDDLIRIAKKKIKEGYIVYFNPTGGLKAHVIATALAGFLVGVQVYYMHEEFNELVFLPRLLYLPKGKEMEILNRLYNNTIISGQEAEKLFQDFPEEIERLETYSLIYVEYDEITSKPYRVKITNKGKLIVEGFKNESNLSNREI